MTIGFRFQRLTLYFVVPDVDAESSHLNEINRSRITFERTVFCYVIFTCNKRKCITLLQELQSRAKEARQLIVVDANDGGGPAIENDDKSVLDCLYSTLAPLPVGVVLHYQLLKQRWKRGERGAVRRVCVVTDANIFLLDEDYFADGCDAHVGKRKGILGTVRLRSVDTASLDQLTEVRAADQDPRCITLVISVSAVKPFHKWRLICRDGEGAENLVDDVRKARAIRM